LTGANAVTATRKTSNRITVALKLAAVTVGRSNTALGAFYWRLAGRIGNAKAVTATARKIAILFYNVMRYDMDYLAPRRGSLRAAVPGPRRQAASRRAAQFGYIPQPQDSPA
jgi:hypothetical protein